MIAIDLFRVSLMAWVASACLLRLFSICWNILSSMAGESMTFRDCYGCKGNSNSLREQLSLKTNQGESKVNI
jgi:hypothetical protein